MQEARTSATCVSRVGYGWEERQKKRKTPLGEMIEL